MKFITKALAASAPLALAFATPAMAQDAEESQEEVFAMMAQMFPVEPLTPEEESRLPISQEIIDKMIPPGTLGEMMGSMFDGMMGPIMEIAAQANAGDIAKSLGVSSYELDMNDKQLAEVAQIEDYERVGACFISHNRRDLHMPRVAELKNSGAHILCWTVRSPSQEAQARKIADNITFEGYLPGTSP